MTGASGVPGGDSVPETRDQFFERIVGALGDGSLVLPPPFDAISAAALAGNDLSGGDALAMFGAWCEVLQSTFRVLVEQIVVDPTGQPFIRRPIVDTEVPGSILAGLLEDVAGQLMLAGEEGSRDHG